MASTLRQFSSSIENRSQLFETKATEFLEYFSRNCQIDSEQIKDFINHIKLIFGDAWSETMAGDIINE